MVRVYGPPTPECLEARESVRKALKELGSDVGYEEVEDEAACQAAGVFRTPAVTITRQVVKSAGAVPSALAVKEWVKQPPEGIASVSYQSRAPFDRRRFYDLLDTWRTRCLRAKGQVLFADGPLFVEIAGGRLSSRPLRTTPGQSPPEHRTAFVVVLEGLDPLEAQAALRDCERQRPGLRVPVRSD